MNDTIVGYHFANNKTICVDCATEKEKKKEIAIWASEYPEGKEQICDKCGCTIKDHDAEDVDKDEQRRERGIQNKLDEMDGYGDR